MSDIQNPTALSDYDFLEFEGFVDKVKQEGSYSYAEEHYAPRFESPEMQAIADDPDRLRAFYRENRGKVEAWYEAMGAERVCDLHNAHIDEERKRRNDACLWGVRCTDGYVIHERTREGRDNLAVSLVEQRNNAADRFKSHIRVPAALLHREVPGGEWTAIGLPITV